MPAQPSLVQADSPSYRLLFYHIHSPSQLACHPVNAENPWFTSAQLWTCTAMSCFVKWKKKKKPVSLIVQMLPPHITLPRQAVEYICVTWSLCMCLSVPLTFFLTTAHSHGPIPVWVNINSPQKFNKAEKPYCFLYLLIKRYWGKENPCVSSSRKACCLACEKYRGLIIFSKVSEIFHFKCFQTTDIKDLLLRKTNLRCGLNMKVQPAGKRLFCCTLPLTRKLSFYSSKMPQWLFIWWCDHRWPIRIGPSIVRHPGTGFLKQEVLHRFGLALVRELTAEIRGDWTHRFSWCSLILFIPLLGHFIWFMSAWSCSWKPKAANLFPATAAKKKRGELPGKWKETKSEIFAGRILIRIGNLQ